MSSETRFALGMSALIVLFLAVILSGARSTNKEINRRERICVAHNMDYYEVRGGWFCVDQSGAVWRFER